MTLALAKAVFVLLAVGWYLIRLRHDRRSRRLRVARSARGPRENALLLVSLTGLGIIPFVYVATGMPHFAGYRFWPGQAWFGVFFALGALVMFHVTHRKLGRNWSVSLEVRDSHTLVLDGVYRTIRHPMYTAFWLWGIAQALLLPNWLAGFAGLCGFGILFFGRVAREEQMMLDSFGDQYRDYMARTHRLIPWVY
jgi:protein-S-isoprenylcysteine O-methyltransferase Ste14